VLGTPRYMPPEQMTGPDLDARSDQFSFCVALYEALYGMHPLRDGTSVSMLEHGDRALAPPEGMKIPAAIGRAVLRGLERDRTRRFPSMGALIDELVPPPRRTPVRYAGFAVAAILLVGGTTAAVVAQQGIQPRPSSDHNLVQQLLDEKDQKEAERQKLMRDLAAAWVDRAELERLRRELELKNAEIKQLIDEVSRLQAPKSRLADGRKPVKLAGSPQATIVLEALAAAQGPIEGCFGEWSERTRGTRDELPEATLVVGLTVTADGAGMLARILSTPDSHPAMPRDDGVAGRSILELCVSEQIVRVRFPSGPEQLEIEASAHWGASGLVSLSSKVVGHHPVPHRQVELE
jgi:hypothetical protein